MPEFVECSAYGLEEVPPIPNFAGMVQAFEERRVQESVYVPIRGVEYVVLASEYAGGRGGDPARALVFCGCWLCTLDTDCTCLSDMTADTTLHVDTALLAVALRIGSVPVRGLQRGVLGSDVVTGADTEAVRGDVRE
jgi:hypothetical protein